MLTRAIEKGMDMEPKTAAAGQVKIGETLVNRIGLGTNRITDTPESQGVLRRALELGVNFIDTAHRYTNGASETTIGKTLAPYPGGLVIASKAGLRAEGPASSPAQLREDLEESLVRLRVDSIFLYQLHRVDPRVPIEESLSALKQFQQEGKVRHIGLSEVTVEQIKQAQAVVPIVSVQNQYNVVIRRYDAEVDYCTEHDIIFIPWFPLGGLAGGAAQVQAALTEMAARYEAGAQQIAIAWLLKRSPVMLPIPGTLSLKHLAENVAAGSIHLRDEDFRALDELGRVSFGA